MCQDQFKDKRTFKRTGLTVKLIETLTKLEDEERSTETADEGGSSEGSGRNYKIRNETNKKKQKEEKQTLKAVRDQGALVDADRNPARIRLLFRRPKWIGSDVDTELTLCRRG